MRPWLRRRKREDLNLIWLGQGSEHHREHKGGADGWRESAESLRKVSRGQKSPGAPGSEEGSGEEQRV